jgi:hypothetical protein
VAREPIQDPIDDQPLSRKFISSVSDKRSADHRRSSAALPKSALPKFDLPGRRYWEQALQEDPADYPIF